jgi:hypothetical protein
MQWNDVVAKSCGCSRSSLIIKNKRVKLVNVFLLLTTLLVMCFITMNLLYKQSFADSVRVMLDDLYFGVHDLFFGFFCTSIKSSVNVYSMDPIWILMMFTK